MSQHHISVKINDISYWLVMGFDQRLNEFFLNIFQSMSQIYTSMQECQSTPKDSEWFCKTLAKHKICLPVEVMERLNLEAIFGGSNEIVQHPTHVANEMSVALLDGGFFQFMNESWEPGREPQANWLLLGEDGDKGKYVALQNKAYFIILPMKFIDSSTQKLVDQDEPLPDAQLLAAVRQAKILASNKANLVSI